MSISKDPNFERKKIDLSIGDPINEPTPSIFVKKLCNAHQSVETARYAPKTGLRELKNACAEMYYEDHDIRLNPEANICITHGGWDGIVLVLSALKRFSGITKVGIVIPCFFGFFTILKGQNLDLIQIDMSAICGSDEDLDKIFSQLKGQAFIQVNPHNPTGKIFTPEPNRAIARACRKHDVIFISDFVYKDIYGGRKPESALEYAPEAIEINSFTKSFCMAGQRIGYIAGMGNYMAQISDHASCTYNGVSVATQQAAAHLLRNRAEPVEKFRSKITARREYLSKELANLGFQVDLDFFNLGTNFVWAGISNLFASSDDAIEQFAQVGVQVMSGLRCGNLGEGYLRFALNYDIPILEEATARITQIVKSPVVI